MHGLISQPFFYATLSAVILAILSALTATFSFQDKRSLHRWIFRHWATGYALLILDKIPVILVAAGAPLLPHHLIGMYSFVFVCYIVGLLLLNRGFVLLFTENVWFVNVMPAVIALGGLVLGLGSVTFFGSLAMAFWVLKVVTYLVVGMNVAASFTLLISGRKAVANWTSRTGLVLFIAGWIVFLLARFREWYVVSRATVWYNALTSFPEVYAGLVVSGLLLLLGTILAHRHHKETPPPRGEKIKLLLTVDSAAILLIGVIVAMAASASFLFARIGQGDITVDMSERRDIIAGQVFTVSVSAGSDLAWNAVGAMVRLPAMFDTITIATSGAPVFWIVPPRLTGSTTIEFSGAIPGGVTGRIKLFDVGLAAPVPGDGQITVDQGLLLRNDGAGTPLEIAYGPFGFEVLSPAAARADLNNDGTLTLKDVSILLAHYGEKMSAWYDLNEDGVVDLRDLTFMISHFGAGRIGSRGYLP